MSIEYNPVGVNCNLQCPYCYEHPMRDAGNYTKPKDLAKVKEALLESGGQFSVFGGEPLLADIDHLEEIWKFGYEVYKSNGIQSNGVLINDKHIQLFKKYNVHVGLSLDGPGELNDSRWRGNLETTRKETQKTLDNIDKLLYNGIKPSLIITLYQGNVRDGRLQILKDWIKSLDKKGVRSMRIHLLEVDHEDVKETMALTQEENYQALIELHDFEYELENINFDIFGDIRKLLSGDDNNVTCIWNACDPYTTRAVQGVDANGDRHNCGRTNKEGVNWHKADTSGQERQIALYHTPWENNGCKGCRFFIMCKGQCPGTGEESDWRNKSDNCWVWYKLMEHMETRMVENGENPVSLNLRLKDIERIMIQEWADGKNINIHGAISILNGNGNTYSEKNKHGDHTDRNHGDHTDRSSDNHNDSHGDGFNVTSNSPGHGDGHGDSNHTDNFGHGDSNKIEDKVCHDPSKN